MKLMEGKRGVIFGVSNTHGIAYGIAKQLFEAGAEIAFTYAGEVMEKRVRPIAESMNAKIIMNCDVTKEDEVKAVFSELEKVYGKIDFVVHAVAFANREDLTGEFINTSIEGWNLAADRKQKEDLIINSIKLHAKKGTEKSVIEALKKLNIDAEILEWFEYGGKIGHFQFELVNIFDRSFTYELMKRISEVIRSYKRSTALLDKLNYFICNKGFIYASSRLKTLNKTVLKTKGAVFPSFEGCPQDGVV